MSWEHVCPPGNTSVLPGTRPALLFPQPGRLSSRSRDGLPALTPPRWVQKPRWADKGPTDQVSLLTTERLIHPRLLPFQALSK